MAQPPHDHRPRSPGYVYGALTLSLIVLLTVIALTASQPPPPTIAEFAPQAQQQIEDAPDEQSSEFGSGESGECDPAVQDCSGGSGDTAPTPTPKPIDVNRVHDCAGDPPRQIRDPQGPPCVPYWDGDNGGSTWQGVTRNEIRVVVPSNTKFITHYEAFFNAHFEFYGRKLKLLPMDVGFADSVEDMLAFADEAASKNVFASTMYGDAGGQEFIYYEALRKKKILSFNGRPTAYGEEYLKSQHPYQWSYMPGHDVMSTALADLACTSLKGKNAVYGGAGVIGQQRVFGLVESVDPNKRPADLEPMRRTLRACGIEIAAEGQFDNNGDEDQKYTRALQLVADFQGKGVTSVFCRCEVNDLGYYIFNASNAQGWEPEWLIDNYLYFTDDAYPRAYNYNSNQVAHSFGLNWWSKQLPAEDSPWFSAIRWYDPGYPKGNAADYYQARWLYNSLMLLASGVQMAGPELTPETFAESIQGPGTFPNPGAGEAPFYQGTVRFENDHTAIDDAAVIWASPSERSNWSGEPGAICWADRGKRYRPGGFPSDPGLFAGSCY